MPVIRTDADRKADASLARDKTYWYEAYKISVLSSESDRKAALVVLSTDIRTNQVHQKYHDFIENRVNQMIERRKLLAEKIANNASAKYQKAFNPQKKQGSCGVTGTSCKPKSDASAHIASMLDSLSEGVSA